MPTNNKKIKQDPMDLGTIHSKLQKGGYANFDAFDADIRLVIDNCQMYNAESSEVYKQARRLDRLYQRELEKKLHPSATINMFRPAQAPHPSAATTVATTTTTSTSAGMPPERAKSHMKLPSADEKDKLCKNIFKLRATELGEVVQIIDQLCPSALNKVGNDEIDIDMDELDAVGFRKIDAYVRECVNKASSNESKRRKAEEAE